MPTGISGLYKNTKGAKAAERERLIELLDKATVEKVARYPNGIPAMMYCEKAVNINVAVQLADYLLANGVRVEIPRNDVSLIDGHTDGCTKF